MMKIIYLSLGEVFLDTCNLSTSKYKAETNELINNGTFVYSTNNLCVEKKPFLGDFAIIDMDSISAVIKYKLETNQKTVLLNFADASVPGGLVKSGAGTQEECICRCTNLYQSLTSQKAKEGYYDYNKMHSIVGKYTDALIYSEDVVCFKDAKYELLDSPVFLDVITCPAPSIAMPIKEALSVYKPRIKKIIFSAINHNAKNLILGAWGCGAFGQNPNIIAQAFKDILIEYGGYFDNIVFAIPESTSDNFMVFQEVLRKSKWSDIKRFLYFYKRKISNTF